MRQNILVDNAVIRNAIIRGGCIYIDWNAEFEPFQNVSKVKVGEKHKRPEYILCGRDGEKIKKTEVTFSKKALETLLEVNREHIEELKSQLSTENELDKIQANLKRLKESIQTYEIIEKSVNTTLNI